MECFMYMFIHSVPDEEVYKTFYSLVGRMNSKEEQELYYRHSQNPSFIGLVENFTSVFYSTLIRLVTATICREF